MAKSYKFPKQIHVTHETPDHDTDYLSVSEKVEDLDPDADGEKVAIYQLVEVRTLNVKKELK